MFIVIYIYIYNIHIKREKKAYLRRAGAILLVRVPATIIQSDCLGLGLKMIPNLSKSYLAAPVCIISTAQQARPKVIGQIDPRRAQFIRSSTFEITNSAVFDKPSAEAVEGGPGREYGAGEEKPSANAGWVVWIDAAALWEDANRARRCDCLARRAIGTLRENLAA